MRTNIVIDDALMAAAMDAGGFKTKRDAVEEGLRLIARRVAYQRIRAMRGKLPWDDGSGERIPAVDAAPAKPLAARRVAAASGKRLSAAKAKAKAKA